MTHTLLYLFLVTILYAQVKPEDKVAEPSNDKPEEITRWNISPSSIASLPFRGNLGSSSFDLENKGVHHVSGASQSSGGFEDKVRGQKRQSFNPWGGKRTSLNLKPSNVFSEPDSAERAAAHDSPADSPLQKYMDNNWTDRNAHLKNERRSGSPWTDNFQYEFNPWGGKRASSLGASVYGSRLSQRSESFNPWGGKRFNPLSLWCGSTEDALSSWHSKKRKEIGANTEELFNPWGGKRSVGRSDRRSSAEIFSPWGGKRSNSGDQSKEKKDRTYAKVTKRSVTSSPDSSSSFETEYFFHPWDVKRTESFNPWGGKRSEAFNPWGGKRSESFNPWGGKRSESFNPWGGKRSEPFNPWGGKRAEPFNPWGGKREVFSPWGGKRFDFLPLNWEQVTESYFNSPSRDFAPWDGHRRVKAGSWDFPATKFALKGSEGGSEDDGRRREIFNPWGGR